MNDDDETNWSAVTARCLAYLCLKNSPFADKPLLQQAQFLKRLGLPVEDRAGVIGSTPASLYELGRRQRASKGGSRGKSKRG